MAAAVPPVAPVEEVSAVPDGPRVLNMAGLKFPLVNYPELLVAAPLIIIWFFGI